MADALVDHNPNTPSTLAPIAPALTAPLERVSTNSSNVVSTTHPTPSKLLARERARRRLDEIEIALRKEREAKVATVGVLHQVVPPLIANPRRDIIPSFYLTPRGPHTREPYQVSSEVLATPPFPKPLPAPDSSKICPCGQVFSRPDHVRRHRARNICIAGLDHPGEPKRPSVNRLAINAAVTRMDVNGDRESEGSLGYSSSRVDVTTAPPSELPSLTSGSASSDDDSAPGSDYGREVKRTEWSGPKLYSCDCGRSFNHIGNFNRHRMAKGHHAATGSAQPPEPVRAVVANTTPISIIAGAASKHTPHSKMTRSDGEMPIALARALVADQLPPKHVTSCQCGRQYTRNDTLIRHLINKACEFGISVPSNINATMLRSSTAQPHNPSGDSTSPSRSISVSPPPSLHSVPQSPSSAAEVVILPPTDASHSDNHIPSSAGAEKRGHPGGHSSPLKPPPSKKIRLSVPAPPVASSKPPSTSGKIKLTLGKHPKSKAPVSGSGKSEPLSDAESEDETRISRPGVSASLGGTNMTRTSSARNA